jgi:preprotein translocase subunit SecF
MNIFTNPNFDFVKWRWHAIILSAIVILAGAFNIYTNGLRKGVDFEGGTIVNVKFDQPKQIDDIRNALAQSLPSGGEAVVQEYGARENNQFMIRVRRTGAEQAGNLSAEADAVVAALKSGNLGNFNVEETTIVGPVVSEQLRRQGILATVLALAGILAYIAFRFQLSFAVGAVVATLHDLLVCLAFLSFFNYDMTLNVIAGLLTITGYSVNDTIVIFDRIRENMRSMRRDNLPHIVNVAVNQTLGRTVITAGTALLSVIALYLFGGEVLKGLAFTMMVGIVSGTFSTVFIASSIAIMMQGRKPLKGQLAAPAAATTSTTSTTTSRKPSRRRVS